MRELRALFGAYLAKLATAQAEALLFVVYVLVVGPTKGALRARGRRLLPDTFGRASSHWIEREPTPRDLDSLSRQY